MDEPEAFAWAMAGGTDEDALAIMAAARRGRGRRSRASRRNRHPPSLAARAAADSDLGAAIQLSLDMYDAAQAVVRSQAEHLPNREPQEEPETHPAADTQHRGSSSVNGAPLWLDRRAPPGFRLERSRSPPRCHSQ